MRKVVALDWGEKRTGVAISSEEGDFAFPHQIIEEENGEKLAEQIKSICEREDAGEVVIGLPIGLDKKETEQTKKVKDFITVLKQKLTIPIVVEDERLTSELVRTLQSDLKQKHASDDVAAAVILQNYLDRKKKF